MATLLARTAAIGYGIFGSRLLIGIDCARHGVKTQRSSRPYTLALVSDYYVKSQGVVGERRRVNSRVWIDSLHGVMAQHITVAKSRWRIN